MEFSSESDQQKLKNLFSTQTTDTKDKVEIVKQIFNASGSSEATKKAIQHYTSKAFSGLELLTISEEKKNGTKNIWNQSYG